MPHLAFHMSVARDLANDLHQELVDADRGAYYLGSTGPDMHILSRADRTQSHYFDLDQLKPQDCVESFFRAHRDLRDPWKLGAGTVAFVAGYLTHLIIDAVWITDIYRPFFGHESALGGDARANVLDRVLQYQMDLRRREDRAAMEEIREALTSSDLDLDIDFVDNGLLARWRELAMNVAALPPTWERFPKTASRFLRAAGVADEDVEDFMETLPELLEEANRRVGSGRMDGFLADASGLARETLEVYLS